MRRLSYLSKLFSHPLTRWISVIISIIGIYDLFISQFVKRQIQDEYPIIADYLSRIGWPWYFWVILLLTIFLVIVFESGYAITKQYDTQPELIELSALREEGVTLWHQGMQCISQDSVDKWWEKHLDWKKRCVQVVERVDPSLAGDIRTLGTGQGVIYNGGISQEHNHKVWMQSAWNNRLDEVIAEIRRRSV
jgi:hypothetical protein